MPAFETNLKTGTKISAPPVTAAPAPATGTSAADQVVAAIIGAAEARIVLGTATGTTSVRLIQSLLTQPSLQQTLTAPVVASVQTFIATPECTTLISDSTIIAERTITYVRQQNPAVKEVSTLKFKSGQLIETSSRLTGAQALAAALAAYIIATGTTPTQASWNALLTAVSVGANVTAPLPATVLLDLIKAATDSIKSLIPSVEPAPRLTGSENDPGFQAVIATSVQSPPVFEPPDYGDTTTSFPGIDPADPLDIDGDGSSGSTGRRAIDVSGPTIHPD